MGTDKGTFSSGGKDTVLMLNPRVRGEMWEKKTNAGGRRQLHAELSEKSKRKEDISWRKKERGNGCREEE